MQSYELKRGHAKTIEGDSLRSIAAAIFGAAEVSGDRVVVSYGALDRLEVWTDGKTLFVDTRTKSGVPDDVATNTITAYNRFLEEATGYTSKQRRDRLQKRAKDGKL